MLPFSTLTSVAPIYKYPALFLVGIPEGPVLAVIVGFLVHRGFFALVPAFIICVASDVLPDAATYFFGHLIGRKKFDEKYAKKYPKIADGVDSVDDLWSTHFRKTMVFSKLAYGLSTPFLMSAGVVRVPFPRFIWYATWIDVVMTTVCVSLGYLFGEAYLLIGSYLKYESFAVALLFLCFLVFYYFASKRASVALVALKTNPT